MTPHDPRTAAVIESAIAKFALNCADEMLPRDVFSLIHSDGRMSGIAEARKAYAGADLRKEIDKILEAIR